MRWQVDIGNRKVGPSQGGNGDHNGLLVNLDARGTRVGCNTAMVEQDH